MGFSRREKLDYKWQYLFCVQFRETLFNINDSDSTRLEYHLPHKITIE